MIRWNWLSMVATIAGLCAQTPGGEQIRLHGRVLDGNSAPLPGAEVTLKLAGREQHVFADAAGEFTAVVPEAGEYSIQAALPGYFNLENRKILLGSGANELTLMLDRARERLESLDVSGVSAVIDMDKAVRDQRLSGNELMEVPYQDNGDPRNAMRILPGVVQDQTAAIHVNGSGPDQVLYTLDSFEISDPLSGTFQSRLGVESIQSVSVFSGGAMPAEYGRAAAAVLAINTKTGDGRFRFSATNFLPGVEYRDGLTAGSWNPRIGVSGPIRSGRAWFSNTVTAQYAQELVRDLPAGENSSYSWRLTDILRTQVNLTPSNILYSGFLGNYLVAPDSGLSALDPQPTTVNVRAGQWFYDVKDQIYLRRGSVIEFGFASNHAYGRQEPQGDGFYEYTPDGREGNYYLDGRQRSGREQWIANYFAPPFTFLGNHQIKIGTDVDRVGYWQDNHRTGFVDYFADGEPSRIVTFAGNGTLFRNLIESAFYVQDSWRVRPGLALEVGFRADRDTILHNWNVAPRTGFVWSPRGLERTKISGGYGIVYGAPSLTLFTAPFDQYSITTFFPEFGGLPFSTVSRFEIGRGLQTPRFQNFNLGWEQRLGRGVFTSLQGIGRLGTHDLSYSSASGLAPVTIYTLTSGRREQYQGAEFTVRQTLGRQFEWLASYTRSAAHSNAVLDFSPDQPLLAPNNSGPLAWDAPNRFLSWGILPAYFQNWTLGWLAEWHSGFPFSAVDDQGAVAGGVDSLRYPNYFNLALSIERQLELRGQRVAVRLGVNNVTNHQNPNTVDNATDSPLYLHYYGGTPRSLNVRIRWLGKGT